MLESEGQVAGLEAAALAPAHDGKVHAVGNDLARGGHERVMLVRGTVIEQLDLQLVLRPIELRGGSRDADGERTFITDRKLNQHFGQGFVGQERKSKPARR